MALNNLYKNAIEYNQLEVLSSLLLLPSLLNAIRAKKMQFAVYCYQDKDEDA